MRPVATKLYIVHGSHPSATVAKALDLKQIPYKVVELPELGHIPHQRLRFGSTGEQAVPTYLLIIAVASLLYDRTEARLRLLLLDEPSLGLAPLVVHTIFEAIDEIKSKGTTILLVEQNAHAALKHSDRAYVLETGRIVMELSENPNVADLPDIALEDGDRLLVPQRPGMVSVFGTVFNESSFLYRDDKNVSDYLAQAGGPRKEADKGSIYLLRADGSVISRRNSGLFVSSLDSTRPMPGDAIVVPEDLTRTTLTKDLRDWTQILYQFGLGAAALRVIRNR